MIVIAPLGRFCTVCDELIPPDTAHYKGADGQLAHLGCSDGITAAELA